MNLTVKIERKLNDFTQNWYYEAHVIQDGVKGEVNILAGRRFTKLDSARMQIQTKLQGHAITFIDPPTAEQQAPPLKSARDNYGMGGVHGRTRTKAQ